jgi:CubicO group peptidase (beta-lactamase class C family)
MRLRKWMANALFAVTTTFYFCCAQPALLEHEALPGAAASREEMAAFIDGFMAAQLKSHPFAGATVVVVVKDGAPFFSKGYSFENIDNRVPVDPALTTAHHASAHHDAHRRIRRRNGSRDACRPGAAHSVNRATGAGFALINHIAS